MTTKCAQLPTDPRDPPLCSTQAGFVTLMLPRLVGPLLPLGRRQSFPRTCSLPRRPFRAVRQYDGELSYCPLSPATFGLGEEGAVEEGRCQYGMEMVRYGWTRTRHAVNTIRQKQHVICIGHCYRSTESNVSTLLCTSIMSTTAATLSLIYISLSPLPSTSDHHPHPHPRRRHAATQVHLQVSTTLPGRSVRSSLAARRQLEQDHARRDPSAVCAGVDHAGIWSCAASKACSNGSGAGDAGARGGLFRWAASRKDWSGWRD